MDKKHVVLSTIAALILTAAGNAHAQGFGDYVAPAQNVQPQTNGAALTQQTLKNSAQAQSGIATNRQTTRQALPAANTTTRINNAAMQTTAQTARQTAQAQTVGAPVQKTPATPTPNRAPAQTNPAQNAPAQNVPGQGAPSGGYVGGEISSAIVPAPETYKPTEEELNQLNDFLVRWEEFGKNVKRVSCEVHMREFDSVLQQNSKRPVAHTWGQFRFISPNKLMYHIRGEFVYSDEKPEGEWKEGQNEWMIVLNSKEFIQYDYKNKKVVVFPVASEEQDMDLTMDNGQFPLFFVAKADSLKDRFYMRIITPANKQKDEVWIEAFPRYARDAQQFRSITVILGLKDLQPTYMRRLGVNGKSRTDLTFKNVSVNKGLWKIEGTVEPGWTKEVREEEFSIMRQEAAMPEQAYAAGTAPTQQRQATTANAKTQSGRY
ncbi:MAG: hypothetical protein Q4Q42_02435 [Planctomycetia bacterium]|nr:hypothetical protein [Planctomycetia bacterium]